MTGRRRRTARLQELPRVWLRHQAQNALAALGRLFRTPVPTLMTIAMLGVALALPGGLFVITANLQAVTSGWERSTGLSLFLTISTTDAQAEALAAQLRQRPEVSVVEIIRRDEALAEFQVYSGFEDVLAGLPENPLPTVLAVFPTPAADDSATMERLAAELAALPQIDLARHDADWVRRFEAMVDLTERASTVLASILAFALLLIVSNTIRLEIEKRRDEIRIMELVGATGSFIRRPFVYAGLWYGLLGGLVACLLVIIALLLLQAPVSRVAALYETDFPLIGLSLPALLAMLAGGTLLGYLGSWLAVTWHLRTIKPE